MKYVLVNDWNLLWTKFKRYFLLYFIVLGSFIFSNFLQMNDFNQDFLIEIMGLKMNITSMLPLIIAIFRVVFYGFIAVSLFTNDLRNSKSNLLMRLKIDRWFFGKLLVMLLIIILMESLTFILSMVLMIVFGNFSFSNIIVVGNSVLFVSMVVSLILISYILKLFFGEIILVLGLIIQAEFLVINVSFFWWLGILLFNIILGKWLVVKRKNELFEEY